MLYTKYYLTLLLYYTAIGNMEIKESRASNIFFKETIEKIENSGELDNRKKLSEILLCS